MATVANGLTCGHITAECVLILNHAPTNRTFVTTITDNTTVATFLLVVGAVETPSLHEGK